MKVFQLICNFEIYQEEWSVFVHVREKRCSLITSDWEFIERNCEKISDFQED